MNNQVAINFLDQVRKILLDDKSWLESTEQPINEAFDMAISALREQLTCNKLQQVVTDTISRQAVIDLYKQYQPYMAVKVVEFGKALEQLPSAQPEQAVKGCRNCKYGKYNDHWKTRFCYNPNECTEWNLWEPSAQPEIEQIKWERDTAIQQLKDLGYGLGEKIRTDGDTISRQAAIDELGYCQTYLFDSRDKDKKISLEDAEYAIEQLPSA